MDSPFPGMDPYLETHWGDVHYSVITYARDQLQPRLPRDLRARLRERKLIAPPGGEDETIDPDVRIVERPRGDAGPVATILDDTAEPVVLLLDERPSEG